MLANSPGRHSRVFGMMIWLTAAAFPVSAQTLSDVTLSSSAIVDSPLLFAPIDVTPTPGGAVNPLPARSSRVLTSLQVSFGVLEGLDVFSTVRGIDHGLTEANPVMRGVAKHPVAMAAVKTASAAATILLVGHMAKKNRATAIVIMAAINTVFSVVVVRNLQAPGRK